jgi:hypothetical protein
LKLLVKRVADSYCKRLLLAKLPIILNFAK